MSRETIKQIALDNGFNLKQQPNGEMDLNPYVYQFAAELIETAQQYARSQLMPGDTAELYDLAIGEFANKTRKDKCLNTQ